MAHTGPTHVRYRPLGMGAVFLHVGEVPARVAAAASDTVARDADELPETPAP